MHLKKMAEFLPLHNKETVCSNFKTNIFFPISALAFFLLEATMTLGYCIGIAVAFIIACVLATQITSVYDLIKKADNGVRIYSFLTSIGICWGGRDSFYKDWTSASTSQALEAKIPVLGVIVRYASILCAIFAFLFVFVAVVYICNRLYVVFKDSKIFSDIKVGEAIIYSVLIVAVFAYSAVAFLKTEAFYATDELADIIYTADSPKLIKSNVYLSLTNLENDLRQPLFAVFSAPFMGIPYLIGKVFSSVALKAMVLNFAQIVILFITNFLVTKMMKLNSLKRVCFELVSVSSYTFLLFSVLMEQYIIVYFWTILFFYLYCENNTVSRLALYGSAGSLLTNAVLFIVASKKSFVRDFKQWFKDIFTCAVGFVMLMLTFGRFDIFFNLFTKVTELTKYTGKSVTFIDKIYQYFAYIRNLFVAPVAGIDYESEGHAAWLLKPIVQINIIGVVILLLCIISAIINRKQKSSQISLSWIAFSFAVLVLLGWGTYENGLILYSLYFGWAFLVLMFQLIESIENKLRISFLVPLFSVAASIYFAITNIPAISEMISFASTYYPH